MKNLTWQNPEQLFVAQELINKVKSKCCGIKVIEKSTSATRKHYQMKIGLVLQERIKEQDSCILISRQGFKPLKINLNITKGGDANQPTMHFLNIQLANSTSEQVSKITQKQEQVVKIAFEIKKLKRIK